MYGVRGIIFFWLPASSRSFLSKSALPPSRASVGMVRMEPLERRSRVTVYRKGVKKLDVIIEVLQRAAFFCGFFVLSVSAFY